MQSARRSSTAAARTRRRDACRRLPAAGAAALLVAAVVCWAVACGTPDPESEPTSVTSTARTASSEPATSVTIGELGGRRNPIPMGQEAQIGGWKVKVLKSTLDATQAVLEENMFNDPPEPGSQYVLVSIEAAYLGAGSSTFWVDMTYEFVGGEGGTFEPSSSVAPDSILDDGEVLAGGLSSGNLLFAVASDQVSGGTLVIEEAFAHDDTRVFFAVR